MKQSDVTEAAEVVYTVVKHSHSVSAENAFSIAILNRTDEKFISLQIEELNRLNPNEIIIFNSRIEIKNHWAPLKKILTNPLQKLNAGQLVNMAIQEASSPYVLVIWNDMRFVSTNLSSHLFLRLEEKGHLCTTPQLCDEQDEQFLPLPSITAPVFNHNGFSIQWLSGSENEQKVFIPVDYVGFYNKQRFLNVGGYDATISNPYWQKADFAMRLAMWGETIHFNPLLTLYYHQSSPPIDEEVTDLSCKLFALKCLAPELRTNGIYLPWYTFKVLMGHTGGWVIFKQIRRWLQENKFRFCYDAEQVVDLWFK